MNRQDEFKKVVAHCKEYGFIYQSSEVYDGLSAVYDYGPYGVELKNNLKQYWWKSMVQMNDNIVGIDAAIFMHPKVWKASGHVDAFNDPLIDNKDSNKRYRADQLIEGYMDKIEGKLDSSILCFLRSWEILREKKANSICDQKRRRVFLSTLVMCKKRRDKNFLLESHRLVRLLEMRL